MVDITVLELNIDEGSFTTALPFSAVTEDDEESDSEESVEETDEPTADDSSGGRSKALGILGVFLFLVIAAAVVKYLSGGDEDPEVEIETSDDGPIGVTVDTDDE